MNLTPDALYSVALQMKGEDLVRMCSIDQRTMRICRSEKFNRIWIANLKDEFNIDYNGDNAYMEYLQNVYMFKQKYWIATIFNENDQLVEHAKIFRKHEAAIAFLVQEYNKFHKKKFEFR